MLTIEEVESALSYVRKSVTVDLSDVERCVGDMGGQIIRVDETGEHVRRVTVGSEGTFEIVVGTSATVFDVWRGVGLLLMTGFDDRREVYKLGTYVFEDMMVEWAADRFASMCMITDTDVVRIGKTYTSLGEVHKKFEMPLSVLVGRFHMDGYFLDHPLRAY